MCVHDELEEWFAVNAMDDMDDDALDDQVAEMEGGMPNIWENATGMFSRN